MARAFAPGHVSGAFAVHDEAPDALAKGSRGFGWSVAAGATATVVRSRPGTGPTVTVRAQGRALPDAPVTRRALALLTDAPLAVDVELGLPVGQGFGMSAAGSLAACLAATVELGLDTEDALRCAHRAEVESGTGLGDAIGSWFGAGEVRMRPGCPPHGWATRVEPPAGARMLYCVLGAAIATPSIIRDEAWKRRTRDVGDAAVDRVLAAKRGGAWEAILAESAVFSQELGLMPDAMRAAAASLPSGWRWGQCMLGNTLWATGPLETLDAARATLGRHGTTLEHGVDEHGARVVR